MRMCKLACLAAVVLTPSIAPSEAPEPRHKDATRSATIEAVARQAWAVTDLVLLKDIDPPVRQQMFHSGLGFLFAQETKPTPVNLAERVSSVTTPEQLTALLAEVWPKEDDPRKAGLASTRERIFIEGMFIWRGENRVFYLPPQEAKRHEMIAGNRYVGTGIQIRQNDKEKLAQIVIPFPNGPARKAGARPGDLIVEVDGKSMEGLSLAKVVESLQGDEGTKVSMTVRQPDEKKTRVLPMVRSIIPFSSVRGYRRTGEESWSFSIDPGSAIAYVSIDDIRSSTLLELRKIEPLVQAEGMKALVLDLRFTRGDDIRHAALVADGLIDGGTLWRVRDRDGREKEYKADRDCLFREVPMVIMVGEHTGSMAATVAAALQDRGRAVVVGEMPKTELTVTSLMHLPEDGGALLLRTGRVERSKRTSVGWADGGGPPAGRGGPPPSAHPTDVNRLLPDHQVAIERKEMGAVMEWMRQQESPEPKADAKPPADPQLNKAIDLLRSALDKKTSK